MTPFWYALIPAGWPSWLTEFCSGVLCVALAWAATFGAATAVGAAVLATAFSLLYELVFDPHGWNPTDVAQRQVGIVAAAGLWAVAL